MNTTIVFAHPWEGSLNRAILDKVMYKLRQDGDTINLIDLYQDGFNPVMSGEDLSLYNKGKSTDPMVDRYNAILDNTERIVFIFPIWWYDMPAILRGFFDKVMLNHSAFTEDRKGMHPIRNIKNTIIFTTSTAPTKVLINYCGDPVNGTIIESTFKDVGFFNAKWHNFGGIRGKTKEDIAQYLNAIPDLI